MAVFAILQTEEKGGAVFHRIPQILCRMESLVQPQRLNATVQFLWGLTLPEVLLSKTFSGGNLREDERLRLNQSGCIYEGEGDSAKSSAIMTNS
jgi:hypothetical protein